MNLENFIADMPRRAELASRCGTNPDYLWQIATGWRGKRASTGLAQAIERESEQIGPEKVTKESLRPDVWGDEKAA